MKVVVVGVIKECEEKFLKECFECYFMKLFGVYVCLKCGFKLFVGQDVEIDGICNIKKMSKYEMVYIKSDKQFWWSQIKFYQCYCVVQGKFVSDGWCVYIFQEKFGEWFNGLSDFLMEIILEVSNYIKYKFIKFVKCCECLQQMGKKFDQDLFLFLSVSINYEFFEGSDG